MPKEKMNKRSRSRSRMRNTMPQNHCQPTIFTPVNAGAKQSMCDANMTKMEGFKFQPPRESGGLCWKGTTGGKVQEEDAKDKLKCDTGSSQCQLNKDSEFCKPGTSENRKKNSPTHKGDGGEQKLALIKDYVMQVLNLHPNGIALEKFNFAFLREHGVPLMHSHYGFHDVVELLKSMPDCVEMKCCGSDRHVLLLPKLGFNGVERQHPPLHLPASVVDVFHNIVKEKRGIRLEDLIPEYEMRTGKRIDLSELGVLCVPDLLSQLSCVFKVLKRNENQYVLYDSAIPDSQLSKEAEYCQASNTSHEFEERQTLSKDTVLRLKELFEEEYPSGLRIDEVLGAYKGIYGGILDDLNHEVYGYLSLEGLLRAYPDVVRVEYCDDSVMVLPTLILPSEEMAPSAWPLRVAKAGELYKRLDVGNLLSCGELVEVVVGEVYTPHHFWIIHRGNNTSHALNSLMDRMFEFYSSEIGKRYKVSQATAVVGSPVVALYAEDMNYYRALITALEDLRTVKLFLVDYGTVCRCDISFLRRLHNTFFTLPAQAIKAALSEVYPPDGRRTWTSQTSRRFLEMIQNRGLVAEVIHLQDKAYVDLWDTNGDEDISIGRLLFEEGWAASKVYLDMRNHSVARKIDTCLGDCQCCQDQDIAIERKSTDSILGKRSHKVDENRKGCSVNACETDNAQSSVDKEARCSEYVLPHASKSKVEATQSVTSSPNYTHGSSLNQESKTPPIKSPALDPRALGNQHHHLGIPEIEHFSEPRLLTIFTEVLATLKKLETMKMTNAHRSQSVSSRPSDVPVKNYKKELTQLAKCCSGIDDNSCQFNSDMNKLTKVPETSQYRNVANEKLECHKTKDEQESGICMASGVAPPSRPVPLLQHFTHRPGYQLQSSVMSKNTPIMSNNTSVMSDNTSLMSNNTSLISNNTPIMSNNTRVMSNNTSVMSNNTPIMSNNTSIISNNTTVMSNNTSPIFKSSVIESHKPCIVPGQQIECSTYKILRCLDILSELSPQKVQSCPAYKKEMEEFAENPDEGSDMEQIFYSDVSDEDMMESEAVSLPPLPQYDSMDVIPTQLTRNVKIHVLLLDEVPFILRGEISELCLHSDELQSFLDGEGINLPTIILNKDDDVDIYLKLLKYDCVWVYEKSGRLMHQLVLYCLETLPAILHAVGTKDAELVAAAEKLVGEYAQDEESQTKLRGISYNGILSATTAQLPMSFLLLRDSSVTSDQSIPSPGPMERGTITPDQCTPLPGTTERGTVTPDQQTLLPGPVGRGLVTPDQPFPSPGPVKRGTGTPDQHTPSPVPVEKGLVTSVQPEPTPSPGPVERVTGIPDHHTPSPGPVERCSTTPDQPTPSPGPVERCSTTPDQRTPSPGPVERGSTTPDQHIPSPGPVERGSTTPDQRTPSSGPVERGSTTPDQRTPSPGPVERGSTTPDQPLASPGKTVTQDQPLPSPVRLVTLDQLPPSPGKSIIYDYLPLSPVRSVTHDQLPSSPEQMEGYSVTLPQCSPIPKLQETCPENIFDTSLDYEDMCSRGCNIIQIRKIFNRNNVNEDSNKIRESQSQEDSSDLSSLSSDIDTDYDPDFPDCPINPVLRNNKTKECNSVIMDSQYSNYNATQSFIISPNLSSLVNERRLEEETSCCDSTKFNPFEANLVEKEAENYLGSFMSDVTVDSYMTSTRNCSVESSDNFTKNEPHSDIYFSVSDLNLDEDEIVKGDERQVRCSETVLTDSSAEPHAMTFDSRERHIEESEESCLLINPEANSQSSGCNEETEMVDDKFPSLENLRGANYSSTDILTDCDVDTSYEEIKVFLRRPFLCMFTQKTPNYEAFCSSDCQKEMVKTDCQKELVETDCQKELVETDCQKELVEMDFQKELLEMDCQKELVEMDCQKELVEMDCQKELVEMDCQNELVEMDCQKELVEMDYQKELVEMDGQKELVEMDCQKELVETDCRKELIETDCQKELVEMDGQKELVEMDGQKELLETDCQNERVKTDCLKKLVNMDCLKDLVKTDPQEEFVSSCEMKAYPSESKKSSLDHSVGMMGPRSPKDSTCSFQGSKHSYEYSCSKNNETDVKLEEHCNYAVSRFIRIEEHFDNTHDILLEKEQCRHSAEEQNGLTKTEAQNPCKVDYATPLVPLTSWKSQYKTKVCKKELGLPTLKPAVASSVQHKTSTTHEGCFYKLQDKFVEKMDEETLKAMLRLEKLIEKVEKRRLVKESVGVEVKFVPEYKGVKNVSKYKGEENVPEYKDAGVLVKYPPRTRHVSSSLLQKNSEMNFQIRKVSAGDTGSANCVRYNGGGSGSTNYTPSSFDNNNPTRKCSSKTDCHKKVRDGGYSDSNLLATHGSFPKVPSHAVVVYPSQQNGPPQAWWDKCSVYNVGQVPVMMPWQSHIITYAQQTTQHVLPVTPFVNIPVRQYPVYASIGNHVPHQKNSTGSHFYTPHENM